MTKRKFNLRIAFIMTDNPFKMPSDDGILWIEQMEHQLTQFMIQHQIQQIKQTETVTPNTFFGWGTATEKDGFTFYAEIAEKVTVDEAINLIQKIATIDRHNVTLSTTGACSVFECLKIKLPINLAGLHICYAAVFHNYEDDWTKRVNQMIKNGVYETEFHAVRSTFLNTIKTNILQPLFTTVQKKLVSA